MTLDEIHLELAALGVSSEVHALVDDLQLDFGKPYLAARKILRRNSPRLPYLKPRCHVYFPYFDLQTVQGRLF